MALILPKHCTTRRTDSAVSLLFLMTKICLTGDQAGLEAVSQRAGLATILTDHPTRRMRVVGGLCKEMYLGQRFWVSRVVCTSPKEIQARL